MSIAYKCDRCGSYFDDANHQYQPDMYRVYRTRERFQDASATLCPSCHERFNDIMRHWFEPGTDYAMTKPVTVDKPEASKKKGWWRK